MRFSHLLLLTGLLFCAFPLRSQAPCRMNYQAPPELLRAFPAVAPATANFIIPTVVHIYYDSTSTASALPSYQDILGMISAMNVRLQKLNGDTISICNLYRPIIGNPHIELRLAKKDTAGNCISGIYYHYVTNRFSAASQYQNTNHYLNIHINVQPSTAAAFAYYPSTYSASNPPTTNDGIHFVFAGSIYNSSLCAHEAGHYFGLLHTFGNVNQVGNCGDDYVSDTPMTAGSPAGTCDTLLSTCTVGVIENSQNYMDYSACETMFTNGQVSRMQSILNDTTLNRYRLWQNANLAYTGVVNPPSCSFAASIIAISSPDLNIACTAHNINTFTCNPLTAVPDSIRWTFQNGIPAQSTLGTQQVSFTSSGLKNIQLVAWYQNTPHTYSMQYLASTPDSLLTANGLFFGNQFPFAENFENGFSLPDGHFKVVAADTTWRVKTGTGYNSDSCLYVAAEHNSGTDTNTVTLGTFNLQALSHPFLTFYVSTAWSPNEIGRKLMIRGRTLCSSPVNTWLDIEYDSVMRMNNTGPNFIPSSAAQWKKITVNLSALKPSWNEREAEISLLLVKDFSLGNADNPFYLDNVSIRDSVAGQPPVASFSITDSVFCAGSCHYLELVDRSANLPTHWHWYFAGYPDAPVILDCFNLPFLDSMQLFMVATNEFGSDTAWKWIYTQNLNAVTATGSSPLCYGDTATLSVTGFPPGSTFLWSNTSSSNPAATLLTRNDSIVQAVPNGSPMHYTVTVTNPLGCQAIRNVTVNLNFGPTISFTSSSHCVAPGDTVTLSGFNLSNFPLQWNPAPVFDTTSGLVVHAVLQSSTLIDLSCTNPSSGCTSHWRDSIHVSNPYPAVHLTASDTDICAGQMITLHANPNVPLSISWNRTPCCSPMQLYGDSATGSPTATTYYTAYMTDNYGCQSLIDSVTVHVSPPPAFWVQPYNDDPYFASVIKMCINVDSLTLLAQGNPANTYAWSASGGYFTNVNGANATYHNPNPGSYVLYVTATSPAGCTNTWARQIVKDYSSTEPQFSVAPSVSTICEGDSTFVQFSPGGYYYYYYWMNQFSDISGIVNAAPNQYNMGNGPTAWLSPVSSTVFPVTCYDWYTGCAASRNVTVNVNPAPNVNANATDTLLCLGQQVILTGSGAQNYSWSSSVINGVPFAPPATATYTVTGTDAIGCSATDTITVAVEICNSDLQENASAEISVYPVPADRELLISNPSGLPLTVLLTDASGRIIEQQQNAAALIRMDTGSLAAGNYFVTVRSETLVQAFRIVVQH